MERRLHRSMTNKMLGGVCSGIAETYSIDVTLVRLAAVALGVTTGFGIGLYIAVALLMPVE